MRTSYEVHMFKWDRIGGLAPAYVVAAPDEIEAKARARELPAGIVGAIAVRNIQDVDGRRWTLIDLKRVGHVPERYLEQVFGD